MPRKTSRTNAIGWMTRTTKRVRIARTRIRTATRKMGLLAMTFEATDLLAKPSSYSFAETNTDFDNIAVRRTK